jgi:hypothetical protein
MATNNAPFAEDWSSYRKLVIDTLRRLDERTLEFSESLNELHTRVSLLEHADDSAEIDRLDKEMIALRVDFFQFKTKIEADASAIAGSKKTNMIWWGGIWTIVTLVVSALMGGWATQLFGG